MKLLSTSAQAKYLMMRSHDEKDSVEDDDDEKSKKKVKKAGLVSLRTFSGFVVRFYRCCEKLLMILLPEK